MARQVTAIGKYEAFDSAAVDGSEAAAGILYDPVDATAAWESTTAHPSSRA